MGYFSFHKLKKNITQIPYKTFFGFLLLFAVILPLYAQGKIKATLTLVDRNSPLAQTQVVVQEFGKLYVSDSKGMIELELPKAGFYTFRIVTADKVEVKTKEITYDGQKLTISIGNPQKQGIQVVGKKEKVQLSRYTLKQGEIKRLPGSGGDALKAILTLPGVFPAPPIGLTSSTFSNLFSRLPNSPPYSNSESGYLVLRGGGSLANGYYLDGFPITYPYHLGNQASVVNNNLIKSFDIYTGAFPIEYGFATGGIINIESTSKVEKTTTTFNLNTFLSDVYHAHKITDDMFVIASARKSYPNFTMLKLYPDAIPQDAKFADYEDYQLKYLLKLSKHHELLLMTFGARDRQNYTKAVANIEEKSSNDLGVFGRSTNRPPIGLDRRFRTDGLMYSYKPSRKFGTTIRFSNNNFKEAFEVDFKNPSTAETILGLKNTTYQNLFMAETINHFEIWKDFLQLRFGAQYREKKINLVGQDIRTSNADFYKLLNDLLDSNRPFRALIEGDSIQTRETSIFAELEIKFHGLILHPGVRTDFYDLSKENKTSKRIRTAYNVEKTKTTLLAGYGEHYNSPCKIEYISNFSGNSKLQMEYAEHSSGGFEQELLRDYILKMEGFRNIFKNLVTPDNYITDPYSSNNNVRDIINKTDYVRENPFIVRELAYSNSRDGYSYGVEIFIKKTNNSNLFGWFGWVSYSNTITKRNNHQRRPEEDENKNRATKNATRKLVYQNKYKTNYINFYDNNDIEIIYDNDREELYDLDRTHILNLVGGWRFSSNWQIGGKYSFMTNVPITPIVNAKSQTIGGQTGINFFTAEYSEFYNSARYKNFHQLDIRIDKFFNYVWGYMNLYLEFVNLMGRRYQVDQTFNAFAPYSPYKAGFTLQNPEPVYFSNYIESKVNGKVKYLPLINMGMETRF
ncbi:MAG: TonB-dependent receptor plug domain-containing protein [Leptospiraceae bacterium]|nr:TonB-dependent receptor plug domain-containing protein [Leptospiraceae bacterium]